MRYVAAGHFSTGVWAATGPLRLVHCTCIACGLRVKTWAAFKAHRTAGCSERLRAVPVGSQAGRAGGPGPAGDDQAEGGFALTADDLDHLAALAAQVIEPAADQAAAQTRGAREGG